jgi:hypothetical protein
MLKRRPTVVLMLVYEPETPVVAPVPLVRVSDSHLIIAAAQAAVNAAEMRARELALRDEFLGEIEQAEVRRVQELLCLLVPGFRIRKPSKNTIPQ